MTLEQDKTTLNMTDMLIPPLEEKQETEGTEGNNNVMAYNMSGQELKLQHEEEKYGIYMNTFGYKGGDSEFDTDRFGCNGMPILREEEHQKTRTPLSIERQRNFYINAVISKC